MGEFHDSIFLQPQHLTFIFPVNNLTNGAGRAPFFYLSWRLCKLEFKTPWPSGRCGSTQRGQKLSLSGHKVIESLLQRLAWPMLNCSEKVPVMRSYLFTGYFIASFLHPSLSPSLLISQRVYNRRPFLSSSSTKSIFVPARIIKQKWLSKCCHHFKQTEIMSESALFPMRIIKPKNYCAVSRSVGSIHKVWPAQELPIISILLSSATFLHASSSFAAPLMHPALCVEGWSSGAVATQSSVDGWPLWACLTGNRCVSSEDEGPANKHYWRTSAACHNTGWAGSASPPPPPIHQTPRRVGARAGHPSLTAGMLDLGCMFGPGTCLPQPDQSCFWPIEDKTLQRTWKMPQGENPNKHLS